MKQAFLNGAAAFVGSGAVCLLVFKEPVATSTFVSLGGPAGFLAGQVIGNSKILQAIVDIDLLLQGAYGPLMDMLFSNGLFGGVLFVKAFGDRTFYQGVQMLGGALAMVLLMELTGISNQFSLFQKRNKSNNE